MSKQQVKKILVIEDDATCTYIILRLLQSLGWSNQVQTATNGLEGLTLILKDLEQDQLPELVLVDIKMPFMDGLTFVEELEKIEKINFQTTRIVLLSSFQNPWEQEKACRASVTSFLQKPLTREKLSHLLN